MSLKTSPFNPSPAHIFPLQNSTRLVKRIHLKNVPLSQDLKPRPLSSPLGNGQRLINNFPLLVSLPALRFELRDLRPSKLKINLLALDTDSVIDVQDGWESVFAGEEGSRKPARQDEAVATLIVRFGAKEWAEEVLDDENSDFSGQSYETWDFFLWRFGGGGRCCVCRVRRCSSGCLSGRGIELSEQ
jgi:hypothetical protein